MFRLKNCRKFLERVVAIVRILDGNLVFAKNGIEIEKNCSRIVRFADKIFMAVQFPLGLVKKPPFSAWLSFVPRITAVKGSS